MQPLTGDEHLAPSKGGVRYFDDRCRRKGIVDGDLFSELLHLPPCQLKDVFRCFEASSEVRDALSEARAENGKGAASDVGNVGQLASHLVKILGTLLL